MSIDPQSIELAHVFIDQARRSDVTYDIVLEALMLAFYSIAKNYPPGVAQPVRQLQHWAKQLIEEQDLMRMAAAKANQIPLFH